jgi:hypothetical protein
MAGRPDVGRLALQLSRSEAAIVAAALRQYEPYWSPTDVHAAEKLSELARDIRSLLDRLAEIEPARPPGLLGTFARHEPMLQLASSNAAADDPTPAT